MRSRRLHRIAALAGAALVAALAGCATVPPDAGRNPVDPLERVNRQVYEFNDRVDRYALKPAAQAYTSVVPKPVRSCIGGFFSNLGEVPNFVNDLLQGKPAAAATDACRLVINSTVGLLGCFDVATGMGLDRSTEDFGQTLGKWGFGPGAYLVLPLFGPSDLRDGLGKIVDFETDPVSYVTPAHDGWYLTGVRTVDLRAGLFDAEKLVEGAALDRYSFIRDAYLQRRRNLVYDGNPPLEKDDDDSGDAPAATPQNASTPPAAPPSDAAPPRTVKSKPVQPQGDPAR